MTNNIKDFIMDTIEGGIKQNKNNISMTLNGHSAFSIGLFYVEECESICVVMRETKNLSKSFLIKHLRNNIEEIYGMFQRQHLKSKGRLQPIYVDSIEEAYAIVDREIDETLNGKAHKYLDYTAQ